MLRERIARLAVKAGVPLPAAPASEDPAPLFAIYGGVEKAYYDLHSPEIVSSGPAGTGKSLGILARLHRTAMKYTMARILIVRKTRVSLSETGLVTFERDVLGPNHPILYPSNLRQTRKAYHYPNGSEIVIGGMDKPDRILSSDYDIIYFQEANEATIEDWETLFTRLRNGRVPYQQLIGDVNPGSPQHWIYKRAHEKVGDKPPLMKMIPTTHKDNPRWWDSQKQEWTAEGKAYLEKLSRLTGMRRKRFFEGIWAQSEGAVYEDWNSEIHIVPKFAPPPEWPRFWSIDFGSTHPFVLQMWAQDPDGRIWLYREIYRTHGLVEDHARHAMRLCGAWDDAKQKADWGNASDPKPRAVVADHDAEGRATFEKYTGITTKLADKAVLAGIDDVASRLRIAQDGKPRLFICRDARVHAADAELVENHAPTCTADEVEGYVWDKEAPAHKERPIKEDDHGMDAMRYMAKHLAIKTVSHGIHPSMLAGKR